MDEIARVGPGGSSLSSPSTLKNYKTGYYVSDVYPRWTMEKWQAADQPVARQVLREKTRAILADLSTPEDYDELLGKGEEHIRHLLK